MRIDTSNYSVIEIRDMLARKELVVNETYQRGSGLWPSGARSYFIDTMLNGFPFPKIYFAESLDRSNKKIVREIVDGQQRITSMMSFIEDKFRLTSVSNKYAGQRFSDLDEEQQNSFLGYSIPVDVIRNAGASQILEMFRRMNAFTLPLNDAEKRHSSFTGPFKWFINRLSDELSPFFVGFDVFTNKQIVRMADSELISDIILASENGVISTSPKLLIDLYKNYEDEFLLEDEYYEKLREVFEIIATQLPGLRGTFMLKPYALHTLVCALLHNKYGLPNLDAELGIHSTGEYIADRSLSESLLKALAASHESKDYNGKYGDYVLACEGATTRKPSRLVRIKHILRALQCTQ